MVTVLLTKHLLTYFESCNSKYVIGKTTRSLNIFLVGSCIVKLTFQQAYTQVEWIHKEALVIILVMDGLFSSSLKVAPFKDKIVKTT